MRRTCEPTAKRFACPRAGTYAEYSAVKEKELALMPAGISFEEAAGIPLAALTAYQAIHPAFTPVQLVSRDNHNGCQQLGHGPALERAHAQALDAAGVREGTRVLVHAGAGGVGSLAVQLAKARRAYVITTAGTRNIEFVTKVGTHHMRSAALESPSIIIFVQNGSLHGKIMHAC